MKSSISLFPVIIILAVFIFFGCDDMSNPIGEFGDVLEKIPKFQPITGAENVTIRVEYNKDRSYFTINMGDFAPGADLTDGAYNGWCVLKDIPIEANGTEYRGVTLYYMKDDPKWNKLNYLLNKRRDYVRDMPEVTWREIQTAIWVFTETADYQLSSLDGDIPFNFNEELVNAIVHDVIVHGENFVHKPGYITGAFMDTNTGVMCSGGKYILKQWTITEIHNYINAIWKSYWWYLKTGKTINADLYLNDHGKVGYIKVWYNKWKNVLYYKICLTKDLGDPAPKYADGLLQTGDNDENQFLLNKATLSINVLGNTYYAETMEGDNNVVYTFEVPVGEDWDDELELEFILNAEIYKPLEE